MELAYATDRDDETERRYVILEEVPSPQTNKFKYMKIVLLYSVLEELLELNSLGNISPQNLCKK